MRWRGGRADIVGHTGPAPTAVDDGRPCRTGFPGPGGAFTTSRRVETQHAGWEVGPQPRLHQGRLAALLALVEASVPRSSGMLWHRLPGRRGFWESQDASQGCGHSSSHGNARVDGWRRGPSIAPSLNRNGRGPSRGSRGQRRRFRQRMKPLPRLKSMHSAPHAR